MTRPLLAALAVLAAGCGAAPSGLSPDDAFRSAMAAADSGEVRRALALLGEAADAGHLDALAVRAQAYGRGYLRTGYGRGYQRGATEVHRPFFVFPGQAAAAENAYREALRKGAADGDPDALFRLAHRLTERQWTGAEWASSAADRDSARAVFGRLVRRGADPYRLAALASALGDDAERDRQLGLAVEAGDGRACWWALWAGPQRSKATAAGFSAFADRAEACPLDLYDADPVADDLRTLGRQAAAGNAAAAVLLDSLRAEGLFERHPRLAAVAAG